MNTFVRDNVSNYDFPTEFGDVFEPVTNQPEVGSLLYTVLGSNSSCEYNLPTKCRSTLSSDEQMYILQLYCKLHLHLSEIPVTVNSISLKYASITG